MRCVTVDENLIHLRAIEINVAYHCNLTCRACSHLSPAAARSFLNPVLLEQQLRVLRRFIQVKYVELLGGEPLLHPELLEVMRAVRRSGLTNHLRVVTNGVLLPRMPDAFWQEVDEVFVSEHPGHEVPADAWRACAEKAERNNTPLEVLHFVNSRETFTEMGTNDRALVERIYRSCQLAHRWNSYTFADGYFYKCPMALVLPRYLGGSVPSYTDGVLIADQDETRTSLIRYLESQEPLRSCRYCLGSTGKRIPAEQITRSEWRMPQCLPTESLVDMERLPLLESRDPDLDYGCLRPPYPQYNYLDRLP